jgi:amino acid adenylation domain-containing protein
VLLDDVVGIIVSVLGILKAGCAFVPLDPKYPEKRLALMLGEVAPEWFVSEPGLDGLLERIAPGDAKRTVYVSGGELDGRGVSGERSAANDCDRPAIELDPDDMCYIFFTSGSTGKPKGIAGRLKGLSHFINWEINTFKIDEHFRVSQFTNPSFDAFLRDIFVPLCAGGTVVVPDRETLLDARRLVDWIDRSRVNLVHCVPSLFKLIASQELKPEYFSELKYILMAGERLHPADIRTWVETFADRVQLVNLYGASETTMIKFFHFITRSDLDRRFIPIGKPMEGARALVVGPDGKACPPGSVGEIYVRTPYRSLGYYNQPELTRAVFVPNPFNNDPNDIIYKTGDIGRLLEDGNFEFLGRKDHQVKVRGIRVELGEIESLLKEHDSVRDAVVVEAKDAQGEPYLCAYVAADADIDTMVLRDHLISYLPANIVPTTYVTMTEFPLTLNGKVDRRALPAPEKARPKRAVFVAPRNQTEHALAAIWSELLGVEAIGVDDNFFELGGHSLLATQLMSRIRHSFEVDLPLGALFDNPSVAQLALAIAQVSVDLISDGEAERLLAELEALPDAAAIQQLAGGVQLA